MDELRFYKSILSQTEISQLYKYGNPNIATNATMILSPNVNASHNQSILIDDTGKINNLSREEFLNSVQQGAREMEDEIILQEIQYIKENFEDK